MLKFRYRTIVAPVVFSTLIIVLVLAATVAGSSIQEATIVVDTTDDNAKIADGFCTLREAINNANSDSDTTGGDCVAGSGADTIMIPGGTYTMTIAGANEDNNVTGDFDIGGNVAIVGAGTGATIINGNQLDRLFQVKSGVVVTMSELSVTGGLADGTLTAAYSGGGIQNMGVLTVSGIVVAGNMSVDAYGGGMANEGGSVSIVDSIISSNVVSGTAFVGGAGVANMATDADATLAISNSQLISNTTFTGLGAAVNSTASINHTAALTITDSTISENVSHGSGAGVYLDFLITGMDEGLTRMTMERTLVDGNFSFGGNGAGIRVVATPENSLVVIRASTLSNNVVEGNIPASGVGGGLYNDGTTQFLNSTASGNVATRTTNGALGTGGGLANVSGSLLVANSTVSGNQATGAGEPLAGYGGGIAAAAPITITNSTIADNVAAVAGGGVATISAIGPTVTVFENAIVAENNAPSDSNCTNFSGTQISVGHNLESSDTCEFVQPSDQVNTDPQLEPLGNYGGPTETQALQDGSPAVDSGDNGTCSQAPINGVDQRGVARPQGAACDIGAYELEIEFEGARLFLPILFQW